MGGPRRLLLEPTGSTLWEKFERSLSVLCNGRCNGFLTVAGAPELFIALQHSINRSGPGGRNAGGKTTPIPVDLSHRAPLGPPWFVRGSMLPPSHGYGGVPPRLRTPEVADVHIAAPPRSIFGAPGMHPRRMGQAPLPTRGVGGRWACLCAPDFWGAPPAPPRHGRKYGSLTYGPLPRLVDYTHEGGRAVAPGFRACQESRKPPWALTSRTLWFTEKR